MYDLDQEESTSSQMTAKSKDQTSHAPPVSGIGMLPVTNETVGENSLKLLLLVT